MILRARQVLDRSWKNSKTSSGPGQAKKAKHLAFLSVHFDDLGYRPFTKRGRKKLGMNAGSPGNNNKDIFGTVCNPDMVRIAGDFEPAGVAFKDPAPRALGKA